MKIFLFLLFFLFSFSAFAKIPHFVIPHNLPNLHISIIPKKEVVKPPVTEPVIYPSTFHVVLVSATALLGGWLFYTLLDGLFIEEAVVEQGELYVGGISEYSGYKYLASGVGILVSGVATNWFYEDIEKLYNWLLGAK